MTQPWTNSNLVRTAKGFIKIKATLDALNLPYIPEYVFPLREYILTNGELPIIMSKKAVTVLRTTGTDLEMIRPAVYAIKNKVNGRMYIGCTLFPELRANQHRFYLRNPKKLTSSNVFFTLKDLHHDIQEGHEFEFEILASFKHGTPIQEIEAKETYFIKRFNDKVYNRSLDGKQTNWTEFGNGPEMDQVKLISTRLQELRILRKECSKNERAQRIILKNSNLPERKLRMALRALRAEGIKIDQEALKLSEQLDAARAMLYKSNKKKEIKNRVVLGLL